MLTNFPFVVCVLLIIIGIYGVLFKRNLIKIAIATSLIESGVNLFLIALCYKKDSIAPIFTYAEKSANNMALPTPQALTLTSIVIGLATTALILSFCILIYRKYGTLSVSKLKDKLLEKV